MRYPLDTMHCTSSQGMFGAIRKHDIHTGIDLYTVENSPVYAMEAGIVVGIEDFTGPPESPWWLPTQAVLVEGISGVLLYGEISTQLNEGDTIMEGEVIGYVRPVLPEHKVRNDIPGHSRFMLHMELYKHNTRKSVIWTLGADRPENLLDPTALIMKSLFETGMPIPHEHVWAPIPNMSGRYKCECGQTAYKRRNGELVPHKKNVQRTRGEIHIGKDNLGNGNARRGKRGPGGW